jgi:arylsulfatase A-like enzyme
MKAPAKKPNILVLWGDDIGYWNISYNNRGMMGYRTPNLDRLGAEGVTFTDYYGQQSLRITTGFSITPSSCNLDRVMEELTAGGVSSH